MDWSALQLSLELATWTVLLLLPLGALLGRGLAFSRFVGKGLAEALVALPLLLPPTVVGFYLLQLFGRHSSLGRGFEVLLGSPLAFSFPGLVLASVLVNVPFAVQPIERGFQAIPRGVREAAAVSGLGPWRAFIAVELPLAWPAFVTALVLSFAHTLGEFGVVLMIGGSIPGETRTLALAIYDRVQAFDTRAASFMSALLLLFSIVALALTHMLANRGAGRRGL